jgi:hypothetical protein
MYGDKEDASESLPKLTAYSTHKRLLLYAKEFNVKGQASCCFPFALLSFLNALVQEQYRRKSYGIQFVTRTFVIEVQ